MNNDEWPAAMVFSVAIISFCAVIGWKEEAFETLRRIC